MSWQPKTQEALIQQIIREQKNLSDIIYRQNSGNSLPQSFGGLGGSGGSPTTPTHVNYHPQTQIVTNLDHNDVATSDYNRIRALNTLMIIQEAGSGNDPSATNPQVKWIDQTTFDGQLVLLTPKEGKTLTLEAGGNINISADTTVSADEIIYLQWLKEHPTTNSTTGSYNLLKMTSGGGTTNASDLTSGTVHVDRLGSGASSSKFLRGDNTWQTVSGGGGSTSFVGFTADNDLAMGTYNINNLDQLIFGTGTSTTSPTWNDADYGIEVNSISNLEYNVPSGETHQFNIDGNRKVEVATAWLFLDTGVNLRMETGNTIRPNGTNDRIGFKSRFWNNTARDAVGSQGSVEVPYYALTAWATESQLNNAFGESSGSCGAVKNSNGSSNYKGRFYFKIGDGTSDEGWYYVTAVKV